MKTNSRIDRIVLESSRNSNVAQIKFEGIDDGRETKGTLGSLYYLDGQVVLCGQSGRPSAIFKNNTDVMKHLRKFEVPVSCSYQKT